MGKFLSSIQLWFQLLVQMYRLQNILLPPLVSLVEVLPMSKISPQVSGLIVSCAALCFWSSSISFRAISISAAICSRSLNI